ncbi:MAG: 3-hydroxyacyl-CoA dehydrogenase family protein [Chloroflexota bacterium]|nr:3-hydroxyacyl-CoA dehydrogenase family protein [Chloroflexota bacterium]MDE2910158.1 3-hydroxyacyl-CoA dehydrogenase family protein [Chloroflexota bacterium]
MSTVVRSEPAGLPHKAAIIGAGTMGLGVAETFALAGLDVTLVDDTPDASEQALSRLQARVRGHVDAGLLPETAIEAARKVRAASEIAEAVAKADLVLEAVPERIEIKRAVLAECDARAPADAIIATNTSSLPIDDLAATVAKKDRFLGMHWFNPPEWTPAVELIPSALTSRETLERAREFLLAIGKKPVTVASGPGFVANRIQFALFREALACVEEGLATAQEVDELVRSSFGFRLPFYGPFQVADMAGLDVYVNILDVLAEGLGADWEAAGALRDIVAEGRIGAKALAGFYDYSEAELADLLIERDRRYAALLRLLADF